MPEAKFSFKVWRYKKRHSCQSLTLDQKPIEGFAPLAKLIEDALSQARREKAESKQVAIVEATVVESGRVEPDSQIDNKLAERLKDFLMAGEEIEFVCMQIKKMALKRDGIVATNMRFIMAKPKMLGRFEFIDCMWIDL